MIRYSIFNLSPSRAYAAGRHDKARACRAFLVDCSKEARAAYARGWRSTKAPKLKGAEVWSIKAIEGVYNA